MQIANKRDLFLIACELKECYNYLIIYHDKNILKFIVMTQKAIVTLNRCCSIDPLKRGPNEQLL